MPPSKLSDPRGAPSERQSAPVVIKPAPTCERITLQSETHADWDKAELDFFNLNRSYPDRYLYQVYLERITVYRNEPPGDDWDGVFTHTSK